MKRDLAIVCAVGAGIGLIACARSVPVTDTAPASGTAIVSAPLSPGARWSGTFAAVSNRSAEVGMRVAVSVHGSVALTHGSTPGRTHVALRFSGYRASNLGWNIVRSSCGGGGDMILAANAFPLLNVSGDTNAQLSTDLNFPLPTSDQTLSVNIYRADGVVTQSAMGIEGIVGCSNLRFLR